MTTDNTKLIAFHLPQFHPIPENNAIWGNGFTEWTNVTKAKPLFKGHYQPHLPKDLGFYDLRVPETRTAQAELANKYGIDGFCYYHYWFNGKLLLERPIEEILERNDPNFPYCLCWANESWSKRWLGENEEIFVQQNYNEEDHYKHAIYLSKYFSDPRYIKNNGKPVFTIYRPSDIPNIEKAIQIFKETCLKETGLELFIVGSNSHEWNTDVLLSYGFDAVLNFRPQLGVLPFSLTDKFNFNRLIRNLRKFGIANGKKRLYEYQEAINIMQLIEPETFDKIIPTVFLGWDNTARKGDAAIVINGDSPELFLNELNRVHRKLQNSSENNKFIFINAWNEWAEGCHLEPDTKNEHAYLETIREFKQQINGR